MAATRKKSSSTPAILTSSAATYYTVPTSTIAKDITFDFYNADTANAIGVTAYLVPASGTASATNTIFAETSPGGMILAPNEWRSIPLDQSLGAGDFIQLKASIGSKVSCHITVTEVT
jgi:hypothetical protein